MGSLFLLKKSASSLSPHSRPNRRFVFSALSHLFASNASYSSDRDATKSRFGSSQVQSFSTKSYGPPALADRPGCRGFHSGRPSFFSAGFALEDFSDGDNRKNQGSGVADDGLDISKLGIEDNIVSALARKGITKLFPIQRAVLEPSMKGRDMIGRAKTGTGKTLAFGIPILDKIIRFNAQHGHGRNPLALVLAPTRELARQVDKEFYESAPCLDTLCVYGGTPIMRQMSTLDRGVDIVVGTPGRVIDLIKRGSLNLSEIRFVVLDEADQMLNVGFADDVETILENIRQEHQTMMFSATMPSWIMKLTQKFLKNPVHIDLVGDNDQKLAEGISLFAIASENNQKAAVVGSLITEHANGGKCIVFTQTKRDADRLAYTMQKSFRCEALHGDISQNQRERTLSSFRDGRVNVLVATDVAARGLDVPNVDLVIHFELPNSSEIFVHRSGRTGRAGKKGIAILMYSSNQYRDVKTIERDIGCRFTELPRISVQGGSMDMLDDFGRGSEFGSFGAGRGSSAGRYSGPGNSGGGRFGGGSFYARSGGYASRGGFGDMGGSDRGGGYGKFSRSADRGGNSNRAGSFGGFGNSSRSSSFGDFGSGRLNGFGNANSAQDSNSGGSFGFTRVGSNDGDQIGRKLF